LLLSLPELETYISAANTATDAANADMNKNGFRENTDVFIASQPPSGKQLSFRHREFWTLSVT
jgi:hypothetical protein